MSEQATVSHDERSTDEEVEIASKISDTSDEDPLLSISASDAMVGRLLRNFSEPDWGNQLDRDCQPTI